MRKPVVAVLLVSAAALATLGALVDWLRLDGAREGHGYGFLSRGAATWTDSLSWSMRPPSELLVVTVVAAWTLAVVSLRQPRLAARLALPVAVLLAVPLTIGSTFPFGSFSRPVTADLTLVPALGLWAALGSLALAAVATVVGLSGRPRPERG